jgi:hypothetical protein
MIINTRNKICTPFNWQHGAGNLYVVKVRKAEEKPGGMNV